MQFIPNGPDVPDVLLQAQDEDKVVFFCGAGISYPAGLPGFEGLVAQVYDDLGTVPEPIENDSISKGRFDVALDLLERRYPGGRIRVRQAIQRVLIPDFTNPSATSAHEALLQLSRGSDAQLRLVTTNFDRVFERIGQMATPRFASYAAPMLPIPKASRWNGLVYLHGLLPDDDDDSALNRLVVTSGDFGLAYLTERWAARFVSELFRNFVVCFVGYSIEDPVLRYMLDALAADRMLGESTNPAYAFGASSQDDAPDIEGEWDAKGVVPILYRVPAGTHDHSLLHRTLTSWSDTHANGVLGRERIVVDNALARPIASSAEDDFVGRLLWAISHKSGLPAKQFADHNPVPPIEWLLAFSEPRFGHHDLSRFQVSPDLEIDEKLAFGLASHPAPYKYSNWMGLVSGSARSGKLDYVSFQIARWLTRHLGDPELIFWLAERGGHLSDEFHWLVERQLAKLDSFEDEGNKEEIDRLLLDSPYSIPDREVRVIWNLILAGRIKSPCRDSDLYSWKKELIRNGLNVTLRLQIRELLQPQLKLSRPFRWPSEDDVEDQTSERRKIDWELVLAGDHVSSILSDSSDAYAQVALPELLDDFQSLLRDALDIMYLMGGGDVRSDRSVWDMPSVSDHWQNRGFRDWVVLVELLRESWLSLRALDELRSSRIAREWSEMPYLTFKRLALFAAAQDGCIPGDIWLSWLLEDGAWLLWSIDAKREVARLLVLQGSQLDDQCLQCLESALLKGPPREMYRTEIEESTFREIRDHSTWLRLAKLELGGATLGDHSVSEVSRITTENPGWRLAENESDEFVSWMSGSGDPDFEDRREVDVAPSDRQALIEWLRKPVPENRAFYEDTWSQLCRTKMSVCLTALIALSRGGDWPVRRWREALQAWSDHELTVRSWRHAKAIVARMPDAVLLELAQSVSWWIYKISDSEIVYAEDLLALCNRILRLPQEADRGRRMLRGGEEVDDPVGTAINHPVGHVTQAVFNIMFKREPVDGEGLHKDLKSVFTMLCDKDVEAFIHGRVILASRAIPLVRIDSQWSRNYLLPLFDWNIDGLEAKRAWEGFLWSPRLFRPFLVAVREQFLDTANHYAELGEHSRQYAMFLTYSALEPDDNIDSESYRVAFAQLPQEGLDESAQALAQALEGAGEKREEYWKSRVLPFWQGVWPKQLGLLSTRMSESLARLCVSAAGQFPSAMATLGDWLVPQQHPHFLVHLLHESELCDQFPECSLAFLDSVVGQDRSLAQDLSDCLNRIIKSDPQLEQDNRFQRLLQLARR